MGVFKDYLPANGRPNIYWAFPREADGIKCKCGGYADRVESTADECEEFGCGRDTPGYSCCARAFVCEACGVRSTGKAEAPDY